jgi:hypothetical protein
MPPMNDQVADIWDSGKGVGKNEDRIFFVKERVAEQQQRARQALPPKRCWHHDLFELLGRVPLHEKAQEENGIAQPADDFPHIPLDAEQFPVVPNQVA